MIRKMLRICVVSLLTACSATLSAQDAASLRVVPSLVNLSGVLTDINGKPLTGVVGVIFALYKEQETGAPLWLETQNVQMGQDGHYSVALGSASGHGLPADIFTSGEARWLGVQVQGQEEQPRVLLLSVPYALKAGDAQTIGGLPPSAFMPAAPANTPAGAQTDNAPAPGTGTQSSPDLAGSGSKNYIPIWTDNNGTLGNSAIYQKNGNVGINTNAPSATLDVNGTAAVRGNLALPSIGTADAGSGKNSHALSLSASAFNSSLGAAVKQTFRWQAEPLRNNTSNPSGTLNLLYSTGSSSAAETGLNIASNGQITFAPGQAFPGAGTITGVTAGSGLTGGGNSGNVTLGLLSTCANGQILQWNGSKWLCSNAGAGTITGVTAGTDLTGGGNSGTVTLNLDTTRVPRLASANSFSAAQTIINNAANTDALTVTNNAVTGAGLVLSANSIGIYATANSVGATGIFGANVANTGNGIGVQGFSVGGTAIYGNTSGTSGLFNGAAAVVGDSKNYFGVWGVSAQNDGVHGINGTGAAGVAAENKGQGYGVWAISSNSNTYGIGVRGESFGNSLFPDGNGSDGVDGFAHSVNGSGVAGVNTTNGIGVYGHSSGGAGFLTDSNAVQARNMGGWVKAMAFVDPFAQGGIAITRCFNSQASGAGVSTPPCGFSINHEDAGFNLVDFGFEVDDRFVQVTSAANAVYVTSAFPGCYNCSYSQVETTTWESLDENWSDAPFFIFIF
jgi:hypothetical protein